MTVDRSADAFRMVAVAVMLAALTVGVVQLLGLVRF
jgi:hypothetical protein